MISTEHRLIIDDAKNICEIQDGSIDLVVTSPPYPMIELWDEIFGLQNPEISEMLEKGDGGRAFELMHQELDKVWNQVIRVLRQGGIACINIGDATRTVDGLFQLFTNHARVLQYFTGSELVTLPGIIWRKQTNAPNKFLGSGMLPPGAYVTLEHEHILILRKGNRQKFKDPGKRRRRQKSAFFWEERNLWFSDVWESLKGASQKLPGSKGRARSAAYPFELAHRLINMFSVKGDTVLDPFVGTGTTMLAAMGNQRNSIGVEIDSSFKNIITERLDNAVSFANEFIINRLHDHRGFMEKRIKEGKGSKYTNRHYDFPVVARQEVELQLNLLKHIQKNDSFNYTVFYKSAEQGI